MQRKNIYTLLHDLTDTINKEFTSVSVRLEAIDTHINALSKGTPGAIPTSTPSVPSEPVPVPTSFTWRTPTSRGPLPDDLGLSDAEIFWYSEAWTGACADGKIQGVRNGSYIINKNGERVLGAELNHMRHFARETLTELDSILPLASTWTKNDPKLRKHFIAVMEAEFPVLALCNHNWKAKQLVVDLYPDWYPGFAKRKSGAKDSGGKGKGKKKIPIIVIPDSSGTDSTATNGNQSPTYLCCDLLTLL